MKISTLLWLDPSTLFVFEKLDGKWECLQSLPTANLETLPLEIKDAILFIHDYRINFERIDKSLPIYKRLLLSLSLGFFSKVLKTYTATDKLLVSSFTSAPSWADFEKALTILKQKNIVCCKDVFLSLYLYLKEQPHKDTFYFSYWEQLEGAYFITLTNDFDLSFRRYLSNTNLQTVELEKKTTFNHLIHTQGLNENGLKEQPIDFDAFVDFAVSQPSARLHPQYLSLIRLKTLLLDFSTRFKKRWMIAWSIVLCLFLIKGYLLFVEGEKLESSLLQFQTIKNPSQQELEQKKTFLTGLLHSKKKTAFIMDLFDNLKNILLPKEVLVELEINFEAQKITFDLISQDDLSKERLKDLKSFFKSHNLSVKTFTLSQKNALKIEVTYSWT